MQKSRGIIVFGVLAIILGLWATIDVCRSWPDFLKPIRETMSPELQTKVFVRTIIHIINSILAISLLIAGIGLVRLKNWGRIVIICRSILLLIIASYFLVVVWGPFLKPVTSLKNLVPISPVLLRIAFAILVLWFFNRSSIKTQFQK